VITFTVQQQSGAVKTFAGYPFGIRIANAIVSYVSCLVTLFWPSDMAVFYVHQGMPPVGKIAIAILLLLTISLLALKNIVKYPYFIFGWLWYLGALIPVIGIIQVGGQSHADRYAYLPFIGIYIIIAWMGTALAGRFLKRKAVPVSLALVLLSVLASKTWHQVNYWENSIVLFKHTIEVTKNNHTAHTCLANAYFDKGIYTLAKEHYIKALTINPNHAKTYYNLGLLLSKEGQTDAAIKHFELSLKIRPGIAKTHCAFATELIKKNLLDDAIFHYKEAVRLDPKFIDAQNNLGFAYFLKGEYNAAIRLFKTILKNDPLHQKARNNLNIAIKKSKS
jgi:tetratricopeptide (TPR) repeat protein